MANVAEPFGVLLTFAYDAGGNRSTVRDNFGGVVTTTYDALERVVGRELGGVGVTNIRQTRSYTGTGMLAVATDAKWTGSIWQPVVVSTHMYDLGDRKTGIAHGTGTMDGYAYDANNRLTVETINGTAKTYAYDTTDQLTNDNGSALTYDLNGNRTVAGYTTGVNNRMTNDGVWAYTYDAEGNVVKRSKGAAAETWVYGYDLNNRLVTAVDSATDGGAATARVTYVYDAIGNRIQRSHWNGSITVDERFAQDGWDTSKPGAVGNENFDVVLDLNSTNGLVTRRLYGDGQDDLIAKQTAGGVVTWYLTDRLGSVQSLVDNSGISVGTLAYSAFGGTTVNTGATDRYQYTGREWDAALGLQFNRDRMYISSSGRWLSEDPSGFSAGDPNLMRYVGNGPTNGRDPSGNLWAVQIKGSDTKAYETLLDQNGIHHSWWGDDDAIYFVINPRDRDKFHAMWKSIYGRKFADDITAAAFADHGPVLVSIGDPRGQANYPNTDWGTRRATAYMKAWTRDRENELLKRYPDDGKDEFGRLYVDHARMEPIDDWVYDRRKRAGKRAELVRVAVAKYKISEAEANVLADVVQCRESEEKDRLWEERQTGEFWHKLYFSYMLSQDLFAASFGGFAMGQPRLNGVKLPVQRIVQTGTTAYKPVPYKPGSALPAEAVVPLDWSAVVPKKGPYKGQSREVHVKLHNVDNVLKDQHGVFKGDGVALTNEAWSRAYALGIEPDANGILTVPMGKIVGYLGGKEGVAARAAGVPTELSSVTIAVVPGTTDMITSFPTQ